MAVSIMSAALPSFYLHVCFLQVLTRGQVLRAPQHQVFLRSRRANMFLLEEILQGNLERECHEETCNYEEAREYFEDTDKTVAFWSVYIDGDQCDPPPCLNGGNCTDRVGGFSCSCNLPHHGPACELGAPGDGQPTSAPQITAAELTECPTEGPTACHQLCSPSSRSFSCSCVPGFKLQADERSCLPEVEFPCGRLPDGFNAAPSNGPWQVSLLSSGGAELCGGVVLGRRSILTAAHCLLAGSPSDLRPSDFVVVTGNKTLVPVRALYIHNGFRKNQQDNDLALLELALPLSFGPEATHLCLPDKDFSENILMHSGRTGVATRQGSSRTQELVYMTLDECRNHMNVSHPLSNKMFCMRSQNGPSGNQNGPSGNQDEPSGNQNEPSGNQDEPSGNQNEPSGNQNGPLGNQNGPSGSQNGPSGNQNEPSGNQNEPSGNQNGLSGNQNGPSGNQNGPSGNQKGPSGRQNGASGNQNGPSGNQNGPSGNQNGPSGNQNGPSGNQNGPSGSQNGPLGNHNGPSGSQNRPSGSQNGPSGSQNGASGSQNGASGNLSQAQERLNGLIVDQNQNPAHNGTPNRAETYNKSNIQNQEPLESDLQSRSDVSTRQCDGLVPGTAVATVERGTAFLTGLLMSSPSGCDGLVFTKLSRYLSWIRPRLEVAEDYMTTQVHEYPENR